MYAPFHSSSKHYSPLPALLQDLVDLAGHLPDLDRAAALGLLQAGWAVPAVVALYDGVIPPAPVAKQEPPTPESRFLSRISREFQDPFDEEYALLHFRDGISCAETLKALRQRAASKSQLFG